MKANTIAWIVLVLLTVASFCLSEADAAHKAAAFILAAAGLKFALVGWQFMDLRRSMAAWSVSLFLLLGLILGVVLVLQ